MVGRKNCFLYLTHTIDIMAALSAARSMLLSASHAADELIPSAPARMVVPRNGGQERERDTHTHRERDRERRGRGRGREKQG